MFKLNRNNDESTTKANGDNNMDEIDQYQARIFAALDKISALTSVNASQGKEIDSGLRERDQALIEELEATIADERADLDAERNLVSSLKIQQAELEATLEDAKNSSSEHVAAMQQAETALKVSELGREDIAAKLEGAEAAAKSSVAALAEFERSKQDQNKEQERQKQSTDRLEEVVSRLNARIENQDIQFQRLKDANAQLRDSNALLRERNVEMLADVSVIDQSMKAELEALKTTRAADVDEMTTILEELKPLVEGQAHG